MRSSESPVVPFAPVSSTPDAEAWTTVWRCSVTNPGRSASTLVEVEQQRFGLPVLRTKREAAEHPAEEISSSIDIPSSYGLLAFDAEAHRKVGIE
jgi:hypothetical protein